MLPGLDQAVGDRHRGTVPEPAGGLLGPPALLLAPAERLTGVGGGALLLELAGGERDAPLGLAGGGGLELDALVRHEPDRGGEPRHNLPPLPDLPVGGEDGGVLQEGVAHSGEEGDVAHLLHQLGGITPTPGGVDQEVEGAPLLLGDLLPADRAGAFLLQDPVHPVGPLGGLPGVERDQLDPVHGPVAPVDFLEHLDPFFLAELVRELRRYGQHRGLVVVGGVQAEGPVADEGNVAPNHLAALDGLLSLELVVERVPVHAPVGVAGDLPPALDHGAAREAAAQLVLELRVAGDAHQLVLEPVGDGRGHWRPQGEDPDPPLGVSVDQDPIVVHGLGAVQDHRVHHPPEGVVGVERPEGAQDGAAVHDDRVLDGLDPLGHHAGGKGAGLDVGLLQEEAGHVAALLEELLGQRHEGDDQSGDDRGPGREVGRVCGGLLLPFQAGLVLDDVRHLGGDRLALDLGRRGRGRGLDHHGLGDRNRLDLLGGLAGGGGGDGGVHRQPPRGDGDGSAEDVRHLGGDRLLDLGRRGRGRGLDHLGLGGRGGRAHGRGLGDEPQAGLCPDYLNPRGEREARPHLGPLQEPKGLDVREGEPRGHLLADLLVVRQAQAGRFRAHNPLLFRGNAAKRAVHAARIKKPASPPRGYWKIWEGTPFSHLNTENGQIGTFLG